MLTKRYRGGVTWLIIKAKGITWLIISISCHSTSCFRCISCLLTSFSFSSITALFFRLSCKMGWSFICCLIRYDLCNQKATYTDIQLIQCLIGFCRTTRHTGQCKSSISLGEPSIHYPPFLSFLEMTMQTQAMYCPGHLFVLHFCQCGQHCSTSLCHISGPFRTCLYGEPQWLRHDLDKAATIHISCWAWAWEMNMRLSLTWK